MQPKAFETLPLSLEARNRIGVGHFVTTLSTGLYNLSPTA